MTTTPSTNSSCHRLLIATAPLLTVSAGALLYRYLVCSRKPQSQSQSRASTLARSENPYETPSQLHEYLLMHFGTPSELFCHEDVTDIPRSSFDFPKQCAIECMKLLKESSWTVNERRVLDVGCAVGKNHVLSIPLLFYCLVYVCVAGDSYKYIVVPYLTPCAFLLSKY